MHVGICPSERTCLVHGHTVAKLVIWLELSLATCSRKSKTIVTQPRERCIIFSYKITLKVSSPSWPWISSPITCLSVLASCICFLSSMLSHGPMWLLELQLGPATTSAFQAAGKARQGKEAFPAVLVPSEQPLQSSIRHLWSRVIGLDLVWSLLAARQVGNFNLLGWWFSAQNKIQFLSLRIRGEWKPWKLTVVSFYNII